ncbi:cation transporter [Thiomicrorhabdus arctica]|uniref:cation transporter n=1 Tax=Thiomicrorhabdus arctica TaxID=131540 RepID=UPI0009FFAC74
MMTDALALGMAWWGFYLSQKPVTERMSFGCHRFQILTAFVNGFTRLLIVDTQGGHYWRWSLSSHERIRAYFIGRCACRIRN